MILSCCDKLSCGIVKGAKNQVHPKGDATMEAWARLKQRYESKTGTEVLSLHKEYISLELNHVKEDPETFITELDEL